MKTYLTILLALTSFSTFAVDRVKAKATTDLLATFVAPSASTTPDRSFLYRSDRDDVDNHQVISDLTIVTSQTAIVFNRGENLALTNCTGDYGPVTVSSTQITITTTHGAPVRISCSDLGGKNRVFYTTYKKP